jgi:UDPglucose 6-dehydrogenase
MTKYAANAMLATRISFMNELSVLCEKTGADIEMIRKGIGSDSRIGKGFLYAGIGYGGSCFPKDVKALIKTSHDYGIAPYLLEAVEKVNKNQRERFIKKIISHYGEDINGKIFALWGLAFKPQTDDIREAPAIDIIRELASRGAKIKAYDPIAAENVKAVFADKDIEYFQKNYDALQNADALIIATEWFHFRNPDFLRMKSLLKHPVIFDGRNQYEPKKMKEEGFTYFCIGR